jgi:hypothetical protein
MEMPKPGAAHEKLARFVGKWTIAETMHPSPWDPKGGTADGRTEYRLACDGFFLVCDYDQLRGGEVTFSGHGVYGWDAEKKKHTMHWFDSMGMDPGAPALGDFEGDTLVFQHATRMGHARYTYRFESRDRFTFRIESSRDGVEWLTFLDSVYSRVR